MTVYDYVKVLADEKGETIIDVERAADLSNGAIKAWKVSFPRVDKLYSVAQHFGVPLEYFLNGNRGDVTPQEQTLIDCFRSVSELDKFEIIELCMHLKKKTEQAKSSVS